MFPSAMQPGLKKPNLKNTTSHKYGVYTFKTIHKMVSSCYLLGSMTILPGPQLLSNLTKTVLPIREQPDSDNRPHSSNTNHDVNCPI